MLFVIDQWQNDKRIELIKSMVSPFFLTVFIEQCHLKRWWPLCAGDIDIHPFKVRYVNFFFASGLKIQQRFQLYTNTQATLLNTENILKFFPQRHSVILPEECLFNPKNVI
jgi:hypothetical protein